MKVIRLTLALLSMTLGCFVGVGTALGDPGPPARGSEGGIHAGPHRATGADRGRSLLSALTEEPLLASTTGQPRLSALTAPVLTVLGAIAPTTTGPPPFRRLPGRRRCSLQGS